MASTSNRKPKLAFAVDPYQVAMSVSASSSVRSRPSPPAHYTPTRTLQQIRDGDGPFGSPLRRKRSPGEPPASFQPLLQSQPARAVQPFNPMGLKPLTQNRSITPCDSVTTSSTTTWHDERLLKSLSYSDTFQKRLEEQAAEAIRRAEEKSIKEYEKKLKNCLKQIEAINKRKKNDLRLIELRKKTEMGKIEDELAGEGERERNRLFKEEQEKLKGIQNSLRGAVLNMKKENSELQDGCRQLADINKQLMSEIESSQIVQREVERHSEIVAQLDGVNKIFKEAHATAGQDLERLNEDCRRETRERKKMQRWLASLIALMDQRCEQRRLLRRIHQIEDECEVQQELIVDRLRARHRSSKISQSGSTSVLQKRVQDMRKHSREQNHILEDRAALSDELVHQRARHPREGAQRLQEQQKGLKKQQHRGTGDERANAKQLPLHDDGATQEADEERAHEEREAKPEADTIKGARIVAARTKKKMSKRRQEIQQILNEMKSLDCKDNLPSEIII